MSSSCLPPCEATLWMDICHLKAELKGISCSLGLAARKASTSWPVRSFTQAPKKRYRPSSEASPLGTSSLSSVFRSSTTREFRVATSISANNCEFVPASPPVALPVLLLLSPASFCWYSGPSSRMPMPQRLATLMRFMVSVPVLSVQMSVQEPSVSITSSFFTNTFWRPMRSATMARQAVTVVGRPCGTLPIMMVMNPLMNTSTGARPRAMPTANTTAACTRAKTARIFTK
mmetsp:Transcript_23501/g.32171  ORF Transcript_23501/g.32171 Transcript_23501/m.32171 type:complete len:231 (-) Transcript_23501:4165-4857(-)